jgi:autotransporter-associated beta strand protein
MKTKNTFFSRPRAWGVLVLLLAALAQPAAAQILTMDLAGPNEGLSNPDRNIFQSHNQKVVENANGIFCTFNGIALDRSTNGGLTFTNVYTRGLNVDTYRAPTIETDENNNIYLIYPEPDLSRTRFEKFTSANGYTSPTITKTFTQASSSSKFASCYDQPRQQFYHATQGGYLYTFDMSGNFVRGMYVYTTGSTGAGPQYPHLFVDDDGVLHFAQTTASTDGRYDSIRYLKSTDGGQNWKKMDGTAVTTPVSCDADSGNSTQINLEDEEGAGKNTWLANMHVKNGKVHFMYRARGVSPERQHYMRFDRASGVREIDSYTDFAGGVWKGSSLTINSISGSFASDPTNPNGPLFAMAQTASGRVGALISYDNGSTWEDCAQSASVTQVDDVGNSRFSPKYGRVIGTFTSAISPWGWATPLFYQFATYNAVTWDSTSGTGWGTANCWLGDVLPTFDNTVDVHFYAAGTTSLDNNLGTADRTARSLQFNANADSSLTIYLSSSNNDSSTARTLTFNTDGNGAAGSSAAINVHSGAAGSFTIGSGLGAITLADNLLVTHNGSGTLVINRPMNESGGAKSLTKSGSGTLVLANVNTYSGTTTISAGTLQFWYGGNRIKSGNDLVVNSGATFDMNSYAQTLGSLTGSGSITTGGGDLTVGSGNSSSTFSGVITETGSLNKTGTGTFTLSGANTYTGGTVISNGLVIVNADSGLGAVPGTPTPGNITLAGGALGMAGFNQSLNANRGVQVAASGGTLRALNGSFFTIPGLIEGTGTLTLDAAASSSSILVNTASNTYSGGTVFTGATSGTVFFLVNSIGTPGSLVSGPFGTGPITFNGPRTRSTISADTTNGNAITFAADTTFFTISSEKSLVLQGPVTLSGGSRTLTVNIGATVAGKSLTIGGAIGDGGQGYGLTQAGTGNLVLAAVNTYTGATTISNGTLIVNGSIGSSTVTVTGGALAGAGTIGGAVTVQPGGTLSPGASIGTLTINNSLALAGTTFVEVNASNGQRDFVQGVANITYGGTLVVTNLAGTLTNGQTFQLFSASGTKSGNFASITPALTGGKAWSFNPASGVLSVASATATYPTNISFSFSGGTFSLTWPATHLGWIAQSNSVSVASSSNWFDIPGSASVTNLNITPSPARTNVYYRLRSP